MAIKKSDLYSSLWSSCDELRGGMDASQYKDYVLVLLFLKYVSDKFAGKPYAEIVVPSGSSFSDMVALKGKSDIGDQINKRILAPLAQANQLLDFPDFNDSTKLGDGKEKVDRLTSLVAIFEDSRLDFSKNRADGDDILGDAYEYLMSHFATESGKSRGQFYTPSEVSTVIAKILGISSARTTNETTVYDPTCGSGSLLLKVAFEARSEVSLYGQEKDSATAGLARMNMILHGCPTAAIEQGNTLASPRFKHTEVLLKQFDYVVANPPFSDKRWSNGVDTSNDPFGRFDGYGVPPEKQGDYAYLLHIARSLKSTGRGACILPHGVLFRGNAEADIRRNLIRKGILAGIVGLPANLFYGTGIPACILVLDKEGAASRKGIFLLDASKGFLKDGPKNRLRAQDIHRIVDVFTRRVDVPGFSRMVGHDEIEKNDWNLNLPRYIDSSEAEEIQDIAGHLQGGIPERDLDALERYWAVCPGLRKTLFKKLRPGFHGLKVDKNQLRATIFEHPEFATFVEDLRDHYQAWRKKAAKRLRKLEPGFAPKELLSELSEGILEHYEAKPLLDAYDIYQHLCDAWDATWQDDAYQISADGWKAQTFRVIEKTKAGKEKDKGWACDLVPKALVVSRFFSKEQKALDELVSRSESLAARLAELEEEHGSEDGFLGSLDKINAAEVKRRLKETAKDKNASEERAVLQEWLEASEEESELRRKAKAAEADLDAKACAKYPDLTESDIQALVIDDKWLAGLGQAVNGSIERVSQALTARVKTLAERYESTLATLTQQAEDYEAKVAAHLSKMGFGG